MKITGKALTLLLVLGLLTASLYGCIGPESDDSGVNENTDTKGTTQSTTQSTTQQTTNQTGEGIVGSVADDVSDALTGDMTTETTTDAVTTAPGARTRGMRGREGK